MFLPALNLLHRDNPGVYTIFPISRKTAQSVPLFLNHPLIDRVHILGEHEALSKDDIVIAKACDIRIDCFPSHPLNHDWYNDRNIYEETWIMAGLPLEYYHNLSTEEKRPKLYPYFDTTRDGNNVAVWPFAGYGKDNNRSPSAAWWKRFLSDLIKDRGCKVLHFGHPNEPNMNDGFESGDYINLTHLSFFDQIKASLNCLFSIGTDSGSSLVLGAYEHPQITLLTNWNVGHVRNFDALAPNNPNNISFFSSGGCDNINADLVLSNVKSIF